MNPQIPTSMRRRGAAVVLLTLAVAACGTTPPDDFKGRWKPVNRYSEAPTAIPLRADTAFYVSPLDRTLKGLLDRWARDAGMTVDYRHDSDFTLHKATADLRRDDLPSAVAALASLYSTQQVEIALEGDRIVVRRAGSAAAAPATSTK